MTARTRREDAGEARDRAMMRRALGLARRGAGRTHPNPSVGAVIFRGDRILGRGRTQPPGGAHAEVAAIANVVRRHGERALSGAALAVTLEPCSFRGRTGACTEAILAAGIARVVVGCRDSHPRVSGRGLAWLRRRGLDVTSGVLEAECRHQHRGFLSVCERDRPWLTLKLATSLDGRIATPSGESRWITSAASRRFVHRLRDEHDAVMIGSETARVDDPALTVRAPDGRLLREPIRIVIDSRLRTPSAAQLLSALSPERSWLVCRRGARGRRRVEATGARVIEVVARRDGKVDLRRALRALAREGLTRVLVEGGGGLAAALLRSDLVDEVHWMLAPRLIGGDGRPGLGPLELERLSQAIAIDLLALRRRDDDLHLHGLVTRGESKRASGRRATGTNTEQRAATQ